MTQPIRLLSFLCLLLVSLPAFAQDDGDISQYLDDDDISTASRLLMVSPGALLAGDLPLHFEQVVARRLGLEVGLGVVLPFYVWELGYLKEYFPYNVKQLPGYSIWLHPKYYLTRGAPEFHYLGPMYRRRVYRFEGTNPLIVHDFSINYGYNLFIRDRYLFGLNAGTGFGVFSDPDDVLPQLDNVRLVLQYNFRFGFVF